MVGKLFAERLEKVIEEFESPHAFSKKVGISDTMIRKYLTGSMPGLDKLLQIADTSGVSLDWLIADRGPMRRSHEALDDLVVQTPGGLPSYSQLKGSDVSWARLQDEFALVPRLNVEASAGDGRISSAEDPLEYLAFQRGWLKGRGINPERARILTARGDSMEETIRDGDVLLIDTSINRIKDNAIYIVVYGDMVLVKRVHGRLNGSLQLISDNPRYPPEEVTAGEVDQLNIAGRVMWFGRTI